MNNINEGYLIAICKLNPLPGMKVQMMINGTVLADNELRYVYIHKDDEMTLTPGLINQLKGRLG